jgi:uncharacterized protein
MTDTPPPPQYSSTPAQPLSADDDKLWASLSHFGNIVSFIAPLIIWLVLKDRGSRVATEGKEALNWGINVAGVIIVAEIVSAILAFIPIVGLILGVLIGIVIFAIAVVNLIFAIMGGVKVQGGGSYRYPINYRWIK